MKILLTAPPGIGKSTVIENFINLYKGKKVGVLAKEVLNLEGDRIGFKNINLKGDEKIFMHITDIESDVVIGNKYRVDIGAIDDFVVPLVSQDIDKDTVVIIDEIGRAQLFSKYFLNAVRDLFDSDSDILSTIVYDEEWAVEFKKHLSTVLIEVTVANRDFLPSILVEIYSNKEYFNKLTGVQKKYVLSNLKDCISSNELYRAKKLFKNAIQYFVLNKYKKKSDNEYIVEGNTNKHLVERSNDVFSCDCDLFNGKKEFLDNASYCSHIDTIRISLVK